MNIIVIFIASCLALGLGTAILGVIFGTVFGLIGIMIPSNED